jgi:hypothetical protein
MARNSFRLSWIALLLLPPLLLSRPATAAHSGSLSATTKSLGAALTLTVPNRIYPRNALMRVTVSLRNISSHPIMFGAPCQPALQANVEDRSGYVEYPPPLPRSFPPHNCPPPPLHPHVPVLRPREARFGKFYVVLRAAHLRAQAVVGQFNSEIFTPVLTVRLAPAPPPRLTLLNRTHWAVRYDGRSIPGQRLMYAASFSCTTSPTGVVYVGGITVWSASKSKRIQPAEAKQCKALRELHLMAGYLNHPAAELDYVRG